MVDFKVASSLPLRQSFQWDIFQLREDGVHMLCGGVCTYTRSRAFWDFLKTPGAVAFAFRVKNV